MTDYREWIGFMTDHDKGFRRTQGRRKPWGPVFLVLLVLSGFMGLVVTPPAGAQVLRPYASQDFRLDLQIQQRLFLDLRPWELFLQVGADSAWQSTGTLPLLPPGSYDWVLGGNYRVHNNLKAGLYYQGSLGRLFDNDWQRIDGVWRWADVSGRVDHGFIAELSPRWQLDFLPGDAWLGYMRTRWLWTLTQERHSLALRPGIQYFFLSQGRPLYTLAFHWELTWTLGSAPELPPVYLESHSPYLALLGHPLENFSWEISAAWYWGSHRTSRNYREIRQEEYEVQYDRPRIRVAGISRL